MLRHSYQNGKLRCTKSDWSQGLVVGTSHGTCRHSHLVACTILNKFALGNHEFAISGVHITSQPILTVKAPSAATATKENRCGDRARRILGSRNGWRHAAAAVLLDCDKSRWMSLTTSVSAPVSI